MNKKDKLKLGENMSLFKILLLHFMANQDMLYDEWFTLVKSELFVKLSLRVKWEESNLLNAISTYGKYNKHLKISEKATWIATQKLQHCYNLLKKIYIVGFSLSPRGTTLIYSKLLAISSVKLGII